MAWLPKEVYFKEITQREKKFLSRNYVYSIIYNIFKTLNQLHVFKQRNNSLWIWNWWNSIPRLNTKMIMSVKHKNSMCKAGLIISLRTYHGVRRVRGDGKRVEWQRWQCAWLYFFLYKKCVNVIFNNIWTF